MLDLEVSLRVSYVLCRLPNIALSRLLSTLAEPVARALRCPAGECFNNI